MKKNFDDFQVELSQEMISELFEGVFKTETLDIKVVDNQVQIDFNKTAGQLITGAAVLSKEILRQYHEWLND